MCIMEVRAGQDTTTSIQAEYHNAQTIVTDLDMVITVMLARRKHEQRAGEDEKVAAYTEALKDVYSAQSTIKEATRSLLDAYGMMLTVADNPDTQPRAEGSSRVKDDTEEVQTTFNKTQLHSWERDSALAARYETRK